MRRNGLFSLIFIVVLAGASLVGTLVSGNSPLLGLDLQGGVSVVLQPSGPVDDNDVSDAIAIIRQRIDGLGVAEPEIARQGDAIVVQLPGVKDRDRALELVGQTARLRFRPVLQVIPPELVDLANDPSTTVPDGTDAPTTTSAPADESSTTTTAGDTSPDESGYGLAPGESAAPVFQTDETTTTTTAPETASTTTPADPDDNVLVPGLEGLSLTPSEDNVDDSPVTLGQYDSDGNEELRYQLGPTEATGDILSGADARLEGLGTWVVAVEVRSSGIDQFNEIAGQCFAKQPACPSGQLAIVLDDEVVSAPSINAPSFARDAISISGSFTESEAKDLALVLRYGALPVELEPQQTQSVSATLGKDALDAGVTAGIVGLALVFLYMMIYYRLLGFVAMCSLGVSAALLWSIIAYLGENQGLALTLAGVTGIIVSIGVAVDSNVVFYEHLKEDVSRGRSLRTAVDGSFSSAFSTIVKADVASLIGAATLYMLTVGPVRGFALYLGMSTVLDLVASYFFMRPLTVMLVKSKRFQDKPKLFGMPKIEEGAPA